MGMFDWFKPAQLARTTPIIRDIARLLGPKAPPVDVTSEQGSAGTASPSTFENSLFVLRWERPAIIQDLRTIHLNDPRLAKANKKFAREAVRKGIVVTVTSKDSKKLDENAQAIVDGVNKKAGVRGKLESWARMLPLEGDLFLQVVVADNEIVNVKRMPAASMERNTDEQDNFPDVDQAFSQHDVNSQEIIAHFALWQIQHLRWNHVDGEKYGTSEYIQCRGMAKKLQLSEESQVVRRLTRAAQRRVHGVGTPEHPAKPTGPGSIAEYKKNNGLDDPERVWDPLDQTLDYFHNGLATVDVLESDRNIHQIDDIRYLQDVYAVGLGTPKALYGLDSESINRDILKDQRGEWLKETVSLSEALAEGLTEIYGLAFLLEGLNPDAYEISIHFSESNMETPTDRVDRVSKLRQNTIGTGGHAVPDPLISRKKALETLSEDLGLHSVENELLEIDAEMEELGLLKLIKDGTMFGQGPEQKAAAAAGAPKKPIQDSVDLVEDPGAIDVVAVCVTNPEGKVLLIRRCSMSTRPGEWEGPAGHVELGESLRAAAIRETKEETGLDVVLGNASIRFPLREGGFGLFIRAFLVGGSLRLDPAEHDRAEWVAIEEIAHHIPTPPRFYRNVLRLTTTPNEAPVADIIDSSHGEAIHRLIREFRSETRDLGGSVSSHVAAALARNGHAH